MVSDIPLNGATPPAEAVEGEAPLAPEATPPEETEDTRTARQRVLDHLTDTAEQGPQSVAEIIAGSGLERGLVEVTLSRATKAGLIERAAEGVYRLSPPRPPPAPPPAPPPEPLPPEPEVGEEERKRRDEAAAAAAANYKLLNQLYEVAGGNVMTDDASDEIGAVRSMLELVPIEVVFRALRYFAPRPGQTPPKAIASWRDRRFLEHVAFEFLHTMIVPVIVDRWSKAPVVRAAPPMAAGASEHGANVTSLPPNIEPGSVAAALFATYGDDRADPNRHAVMQAFARKPQSPAEQPADEDEISLDAWDELTIGYITGSLRWNEERFGPPPGDSRSRVPVAILKRHRLA